MMRRWRDIAKYPRYHQRIDFRCGVGDGIRVAYGMMIERPGCVEVVMTVLHAGSKFDKRFTKVSGRSFMG